LINSDEEKRLPSESSKDRALEALDFVINVLKEQEKDLDRLIDKLGKTTVSSEKIGKVEERITTIQDEISSLIKLVSALSESPSRAQGPTVILKCKNWDGFKNLAKGADAVSLNFKPGERTFQSEVLKGGRVINYNGDLPKGAALLKYWLSKELEVSEDKIFEGELSVG
jgi:hypothetical protein